MSAKLIVGATRGLGASLLSLYASKDASTSVFGTSRSKDTPESPSGKNIHWLTDIDVSKPDCGQRLASALRGQNIDTCIISAGLLIPEKFGESKWDEQLRMYQIVAMAPVFIVESLVKEGALAKGSKVILISSEAGSITLRHEQEGGSMFGHHGSKAALNMVGKQLSYDLKDKGVVVVMLHPGFMRTEMTKSAGFDKFYDDGGALEPDEAANLVGTFIAKEVSMDKTGTFWAPRGTTDIGNWNVVMGEDKAKNGPVQLPW